MDPLSLFISSFEQLIYSDITDYDYSTDSESLRFFFSETDPSGILF